LIPRVYSGDGTLSVMDIRSKKPDLAAQSEDQEDELLSIVAIKGFVSFLSFNLTRKRQICGWIPDKGVWYASKRQKFCCVRRM
jgi:hypothetical protein